MPKSPLPFLGRAKGSLAASALALATGEAWFKVPSAMRIELTGSLRRYVSGKDVILDIEVQGAMQVKAKRPETVRIFIAPPSLEVLERRLRGRGTDSEEAIAARLERARQEFHEADFYDYLIVNDDPRPYLSR